MPFAIDELRNAYKSYRQFLDCKPLPHHVRYIFPFFRGSYFAYRKIDIFRTIAIAKAISDNPSYIDIGCGYGDFLNKVRQLLPNAKGLEKDGSIFYAFQILKPDYISLMPAEDLSEPVDVAFVGWMEPGQDFRRFVAKCASCVITTFDTGGQCGLNCACEYEEFGFQRIAWWRTPSWIDVNTELMNRYYAPSLDYRKKEQLAKLRTAHNFWHIYAKPELTDKIKSALQWWLEKGENPNDRFDFESILDECGFHYMEDLPGLANNRKVWEVKFD
ncbi:MAG TPA: hypothetical protein VJ695_10780 [Nitrososphaera sp.]|nr:hypothetical protein [Nitrososphaera sp.]